MPEGWLDISMLFEDMPKVKSVNSTTVPFASSTLTSPLDLRGKSNFKFKISPNGLGEI